jgi:hypothetical protein
MNAKPSDRAPELRHDLDPVDAADDLVAGADLAQLWQVARPLRSRSRRPCADDRPAPTASMRTDV